MAPAKQPRRSSSARGALPARVVLLEQQIEAINRFPDQNPNPVMRVTADGHLVYANLASAPLTRALGVEVGDVLAADTFADLQRAGARQPPVPIEVRDDHRTFELLPVPVADLGFINLYGTDVTARKAIDKFPDENPNPVLRIGHAGDLIYANQASAPIVEAQRLAVGRPVPPAILGQVRASLAEGRRRPIELVCGERTYEVLPVAVPEFEFINLYGTEVTAARQIAEANRENERLLLNILPPPIAERLRRGERLIADRFEDVSLLIADIVGFTRLSSLLSPSDVVHLLNTVFGACDALVERHGLEKVKTIGDAYMVVGGMTMTATDHVDRVADLAIELLGEIDRMQPSLAAPVSLRIGMHSGPVVAGVIGVKKFIYDVWGDTVNMASRMESLGAPGRVQASHAVYERLRGRYEFEARGVIDVKGKGPLPTYFLLGRHAGRAADVGGHHRPTSADL